MYTCASPSFFNFLVKDDPAIQYTWINTRDADFSFFVEVVSTICLIALEVLGRASRV